MCFPSPDWKLLDALGLYLKCLPADTRDEYLSGARDGVGGLEREDKMGGGQVLTAGGTLAVDGGNPQVR